MPGGFLSGFTFDFTKATVWQEADWFAPGMIYGGFAHLSDAAIGGRRYYLPVRLPCASARTACRGRCLPPTSVMAHRWRCSNPAPRGDTTAADAHDTKAVPMIDGRFQFSAIGAEEHAGKLSLGYWFPGSEGEVTYAGNTYPGGQMHRWRRRYHPIQDGLVDRYEIAFRFGRNESHTACCKGVCAGPGTGSNRNSRPRISPRHATAWLTYWLIVSWRKGGTAASPTTLMP